MLTSHKDRRFNFPREKKPCGVQKLNSRLIRLCLVMITRHPFQFLDGGRASEVPGVGAASLTIFKDILVLVKLFVRLVVAIRVVADLLLLRIRFG